MEQAKNRYFVSDAHLGATAFADDRQREKMLVSFLDSVKDKASDIYFLGDIFDFWYEYKYVVPKGSVRLLGKMAELSDSGINLHFFIGNHDIWTYGYLEQEVGCKVYKQAVKTEIDGKVFYLSHGDRDGYRPASVRLMQAVFHSNFVRRIYSTLHPWINMKLGLAWSRHNRLTKHNDEGFCDGYMGEDKEYLVQFAKEKIKSEKIDYFVFGHRHVLLDLQLAGGSRVIYLGDWVTNFSYGVWDGKDFRLEIFETEQPQTAK